MKIPAKYYDQVTSIRDNAISNGINAFIVGGFVRDLIIGIEPNDIDVLADSKVSYKRLASLVASDAGTKPVNFLKYDTSRVYFNDVQIDFSAPKGIDNGVYSNPIYVDINSRDFTIDALAINIKNYSLVDLSGNGLEDISKRLIDCTDDSVLVDKIENDPVTMLRAIRLSSILKFSVSDRVKNIIRNNAHKIKARELGGDVPYQRIAKELKKIIDRGDKGIAFTLMRETGIIEHLPETEFVSEIESGGVRKMALLKIANKSLAVEEALIKVRDALDATIDAYIAGGFVRDKILGLHPKDADITISSPQFVCMDGGEFISSDDIDSLGNITSEVVSDFDGSDYLEYRCSDHGCAIVNGGEYAASIVFNTVGGDLNVTRSKGTAIVNGINTSHGRVSIDFVSARKESYSNSSHKPKVSPGTLTEDVFRRDFTVNTLLLDLDDFEENMSPEEFKMNAIDITGSGLKDLEKMVLNTPLDPSETFYDDPTRIVRAIRFSAQKGFDMSASLIGSIRDATVKGELIRNMIMSGGKAPKGNQIGDELKLAILSNPSKTMDLLVKTGLSETLGMGLHNLDISQGDYRGYHSHTVYEHTKRVVELMQEIVQEREAAGSIYTSDEKVGLYMSAMMHDVGKAKTKSIVCAERKCKFTIPIEELERMNSVSDYDINSFECPECGSKKGKVRFIGHENYSANFVNNMRGVFSNGILDVVEAVVLNHMKRYEDGKTTDKTISKRQKEFGKNTEWILMLQEADHASKGEDIRDAWKKQVDKYRYRLSMKTPVTGKDVMDILNIQPGPNVGRVIEELNKLAVADDRYGVPSSPDVLSADQLSSLLEENMVSSWDELVMRKRDNVIDYLKTKSFSKNTGLSERNPIFKGRYLMDFFNIPGGSWIPIVQKQLVDNGFVEGASEVEAKKFLKTIDISLYLEE